MKYIKQYNQISIHEQYSGSKTPKATLFDFIERAKARGASDQDIETAMQVLLDSHYGNIDFKDEPSLPRFKKDSGVAIALKELETGINSSFEDGYSMDWIHSALSEIAKPVHEMAIVSREKMPRRPLEIDLSSPDGNAFSLMALAKNLYKQLHPNEMEGYAQSVKLARKAGLPIPPSPIDLLIEEMMSGDYENLLKVFDREFGDYVTLYR
jgi:hypothetical protein